MSSYDWSIHVYMFIVLHIVIVGITPVEFGESETTTKTTISFYGVVMAHNHVHYMIDAMICMKLQQTYAYYNIVANMQPG